MNAKVLKKSWRNENDTCFEKYGIRKAIKRIAHSSRRVNDATSFF